MGFSIRRTMKVGRFVNLNLSGRGAGFSIGAGGLRVGLGPRGVRLTGTAGPMRYVKTAGFPRAPLARDPGPCRGIAPSRPNQIQAFALGMLILGSAFLGLILLARLV